MRALSLCLLALSLGACEFRKPGAGPEEAPKTLPQVATVASAPALVLPITLPKRPDPMQRFANVPAGANGLLAFDLEALRADPNVRDAWKKLAPSLATAPHYTVLAPYFDPMTQGGGLVVSWDEKGQALFEITHLPNAQALGETIRLGLGTGSLYHCEPRGDSVLFGSKSWEAAWRAPTGAPLEGAPGLREALSQAQTRTTIEYAGSFLPKAGAPPIERQRWLTVQANVDKGLSFSLNARYNSASDASTASAEMAKQLKEVSAMLPMLGLPAGLSFQHKTSGEDLFFAFQLTESELQTSYTALGNVFAGGAGAAPTP